MAEKKIGGRVFSVGNVLATDAIRLQARLLKVVGGAVDRLPVILAGAGNASPEAKEASQAAAVAALADIVSKCDPDEVTQLFADVAAMASIKRQSGAVEEVDLDGDFSDHKKDILPLIGFVLKEVLGDFFAGSLANSVLGVTEKG